MPESLETIHPTQVTGVLLTTNRLSELGATASAQEATQSNLGVNTAIPIGVVLPFASGTVPQGWLLCAGQTVSRTTYADLFTVIGTTYGAGDGSTTFDLPDLRGRAVAGRDNMNGTAASRLGTTYFGNNAQSLGQTGGSESHLLTSAQMPAHNHYVANSDATSAGSPTLSNTQYVALNNNAGGSTSYILNGSSTAATIGKTSDTGNGSGHANVQPTMILNYIIKAKFVSAVAVP